ncbi:ABC transporter substrate-binding protein [Streptomyces sp. NPDC006175]|uniref:ABC transporter substrate-binding protein n=1 Tax=unclassified Streptomyces TaxID=2593676 RepID=UPI0033B5A2DF
MKTTVPRPALRALRNGLAALTAMALAAGCTAAGYTDSDGPVKIGVVVPRSGALAAYGNGAVAGIEMVVDDINASGGIRSLGGRRIELVVGDSASKPNDAAHEARRMIDKEGVSAILGPISSTEASATAAVTERARMPVIAMETTGVYGDRSFYIVSVEATQMGAAYGDFVDHLVDDQGEDLETVVITYPQNDYGKAASAAADKRLTALGYVVKDSIAVDPQTDDYTPTMLRVRAADPDVVVSALYDRDGILFHQARYNLQYDKPVFLCGIGGCDDPGVWEALGPRAARATLAHRTVSESLFNPSAGLPGLQKLLAEAKGRTDVPLDQHFVIGAQTARIVQAALEEAGSARPQDVNAAMSRVRIAPGSAYHYLPTAPDGIAYKDGSIKGAQPVFNQWKENGTRVIVYPPLLAGREPDLD